MTTRFDRAVELQEWLEAHKDDPQAVLSRFETAEHEAFLWHVISMHMDPKSREQVEYLASELRAGGYVRPKPGDAPAPVTAQPSLIERLMARVKGK